MEIIILYIINELLTILLMHCQMKIKQMPQRKLNYSADHRQSYISPREFLERPETNHHCSKFQQKQQNKSTSHKYRNNFRNQRGWQQPTNQNQNVSFLQKLRISPHKKYSKLTTVLKQQTDLVSLKQNKNMMSAFQEQNLIVTRRQKLTKQRNCEQHQIESCDKDQLQEISINHIKDPLKHIYLPLALQIKLSKSSEKALYNNRRKLEIKQKIKDRVKQKIHNLIQKNNIAKSKQHIAKKSLCFRPDILNEEILIKNYAELEKYERQISKLENNHIKYSIAPQQFEQSRRQSILNELPFTSRKIRSSLDHRPELYRAGQLKIGKIVKRKNSQNEMGEIEQNMPRSAREHYQYRSYKRSFSTDIRQKNQKLSVSKKQSLRKNAFKKDSQEIEPWIISNIQEQQQNF